MNVTFNEAYVPRFSGVGEDSVAKWLRTGEGPQFYLPDSPRFPSHHTRLFFIEGTNKTHEWRKTKKVKALKQWKKNLKGFLHQGKPPQCPICCGSALSWFRFFPLLLVLLMHDNEVQLKEI